MLVPPNISGQMSAGSPAGSSGSSVRRHRRLSSLNTVSWPNPNELTVSPRPRRMSTVGSCDPQVIILLKMKICWILLNSHFQCYICMSVYMDRKQMRTNLMHLKE